MLGMWGLVGFYVLTLSPMLIGIGVLVKNADHYT